MLKENTLIICVHGFLENMNFFKAYADSLAEDGFNVKSILLPGHYGNSKEFAESKLEDWEKHLDEEIEKSLREYDNIIMLGHSMGCLLSINACVKYSKNIIALILISTPVYVKVTPAGVHNMITVAFAPDKHSEIIDTYRENLAVTDNKPYYIPLWIRPLYSLNRLILKTKKVMDKVNVPTLLIHTENDELVRMKSHQYVLKNLSGILCSELLLKDSLHAYHTPDEREKVLDVMQKFTNKVITDFD